MSEWWSSTDPVSRFAYTSFGCPGKSGRESRALQRWPCFSSQSAKHARNPDIQNYRNGHSRLTIGRIEAFGPLLLC